MLKDRANASICSLQRPNKRAVAFSHDGCLSHQTRHATLSLDADGGMFVRCTWGLLKRCCRKTLVPLGAL